MTEAPTAGRMAENIMRFARLLRAAGLPVGPGKVLDAIRAVGLLGFGSRADLHCCLAAIFLSRREQRGRRRPFEARRKPPRRPPGVLLLFRALLRLGKPPAPKRTSNLDRLPGVRLLKRKLRGNR